MNISNIPIYVRAGAIIPFDPVRQYTSQKVDKPMTIKVYRGGDGQFTMYEDDGISLDYLKGKAAWTKMTWDDSAEHLTIEPAAPKGAANQPSNRTFIVELLPDGTTKNVNYTDKKVEVSF